MTINSLGPEPGVETIDTGIDDFST
ncbi:MAG: hypothetical protein RIQ28_1580, partial [Pseudomonadota bacterium]